MKALKDAWLDSISFDFIYHLILSCCAFLRFTITIVRPETSEHHFKYLSESRNKEQTYLTNGKKKWKSRLFSIFEQASIKRTNSTLAVLTVHDCSAFIDRQPGSAILSAYIVPRWEIQKCAAREHKCLFTSWEIILSLRQGVSAALIRIVGIYYTQ